VTLARACRDTVRVRFRYTGRDSGEHERTVEPVRMVTTGRRWYLMARDVDRDDWRSFRLDRMSEVVATTWRFRVREHPDPDRLRAAVRTEAPYRHLARVRVHARPDRVRELVPPQAGCVEDDRDGWCVLVVAGDNLDSLAVHVARLGFETDVLEPPELREAAALLARRVAAMAGTS